MLKDCAVSRIIEQFGYKVRQKKLKDVKKQYFIRIFFQKYFVAHEGSAVQNPFRTHVQVCYTPDGLV